LAITDPSTSHHNLKVARLQIQARRRSQARTIGALIAAVTAGKALASEPVPKRPLPKSRAR
jgi:hypothetical protein